jgi:hypothetical protein
MGVSVPYGTTCDNAKCVTADFLISGKGLQCSVLTAITPKKRGFFYIALFLTTWPGFCILSLQQQITGTGQPCLWHIF